MKHITPYNIFEGKQRGTLYHIFDLEKCDFILRTNSLASYKFGYISTTRNKMMNGYLGDSYSSIFKLELDGDKLTNNYKIVPYTDPYKEIGFGGETKPKRHQEWEEQIKANKIPNIDKYVNKFIIIKNRVERAKDSGWFDTDGGRFGNTHINFPDFFKEYMPHVVRLFGKDKIYVQDGAKIVPGWDYVEEIMNFPIKKINHGYALYWRGEEVRWDNRFKFNMGKEVVKPVGEGDEIEKLVIGYDYDNLYLSKDEPKNYPEPKRKFDIYLFDFEYDDDDIIKDDGNNIYVKKGTLVDIDKKVKRKRRF